MVDSRWAVVVSFSGPGDTAPDRVTLPVLTPQFARLRADAMRLRRLFAFVLLPRALVFIFGGLRRKLAGANPYALLDPSPKLSPEAPGNWLSASSLVCFQFCSDRLLAIGSCTEVWLFTPRELVQCRLLSWCNADYPVSKAITPPTLGGKKHPLPSLLKGARLQLALESS